MSLQVFQYETVPVRTVTAGDGALWVVAKDVADVLGVKWYGTKTIQHVPEEWRGVGSVPTPSGDQEVVTLSEQGLYFFLARSDKPKALPMQKWVAGEVLPTIRKTGAYGVAPVETPEMQMARGLIAAQTLIEQQAQLIAQRDMLIADIAPKATALDRIATYAQGSMCVTDAAKHLQVQPAALFKTLQGRGWIYRRAGGKGWVAYQNRLQQGVLEHKITTVERSDGTEKVTEQVRVTAKGLAKLAELLDSGGAQP